MPPSSTSLHIVTGKGGTGKTTVAGALAIALATGGRRVLLCEVEGRQEIARLFDIPPLPYEERRIAAAGRSGGQVYALAVDAEEALLEYLEMYYRLGRAGKALDKFGVIDFATTIAPGVRDVLLTGKVYEAARRRESGPDSPFVYDAVVVDAPPTGRITRFLGVNDDVAGLAKVGPIKNQSLSIMAMMRGPQTKVHLVTLLEEMPVQETLDGIAELRAEGLPVGHVLVNMVRPALVSGTTRKALEDGTVDAAEVSVSLASVSLPPEAAGLLIDAGHAHVQRQDLQNEQARILRTSVDDVLDLPLLSDGIDLGALFELADALEPVVAR
ncbi:ArsA-related P-loop ATPase [uncultured Aeromicrobium sp.]|uniref:ArsA-related P-loop ATPase n=1 Tax=uncultured Aeromicrobium sp. TaxID=337820 RepID=UPI0025E0FE15|nr:ArsA-related P-loop ATPase [uncultured Aeromicrobium sp.]